MEGKKSIQAREYKLELLEVVQETPDVRLFRFRMPDGFNFYPRDDTPGCTKEACDFRDGITQLRKMNAEVLGVSNDDASSHKKFSSKYSLNFSILSDTSKAISIKYGVYGEKTFMGKKSMGITRSTFIIGKDGRIKKIFRSVKVDGHFEEVKNSLEH